MGKLGEMLGENVQSMPFVDIWVSVVSCLRVFHFVCYAVHVYKGPDKFQLLRL